MTLALYFVVGIAILLAVFWLVFAPRPTGPVLEIESLQIEKLFPLHCRRFSQISQLLHPEDAEFLRRRSLNSSAVRKWRSERRRILRQYLNGLAEDVARLERLARLLATLSPEIAPKQEWQWLRLSIQFRVLIRMIALRVALGWISLGQLSRLTQLVTDRAGELQTRIGKMLEVLPTKLHAEPS
jgi:hypothetical protein